MARAIPAQCGDTGVAPGRDRGGFDLGRWEDEGGAASPAAGWTNPMIDGAPGAAGHRRPHAPPLAGAFLEFDLTAELESLHREATWQRGRNARTLVKYDDFRVVLTALRAHTRIPEHRTDGRISIHLLSGHIRLHASGRTFDLRPGSLVALDQGMPHEMEALDDSAFLLTLAWPAGQTPRP